ncbi:unnamed protein product [Rotaria sordida]|uniref:Uncharacterized protein n=1 Tax=Rotaria sordida TaxID=392033 RepID=A0A813W8G7_9BILA|nr:unnamed protein product [Rotaria sordida]
MSQSDTIRQKLIETEYEPVSSSRKLNLLLQRSVRYSYRTGSFQVKQGTPADLFELLEQNKQYLNIETYTISQTTLEQIFLSFGKQVNDTLQ